MSYQVYQCLQLNADETCDRYGLIDYESEYSPAFTYNHLCGNSVVTTFVPVILFSSCMSCLVSMTFIVLANLNFKWEDWTGQYVILSLILPELLVPDYVAYIGAKNRDVLETDLCLITLYQHLAILMSFGICAPYVSIMCVISAALYGVRFISSLSRYINNQIDKLLKNVENPSAAELGAARVLALRRMNENSVDVVVDRYNGWKVFMLFVCGAFVGLLQVDMQKDVKREYKSHFVDYLYLLVPLVFAIIAEIIFKRYYSNLFPPAESKHSLSLESKRPESDNIQLNPLYAQLEN